MSLVLAQRNEPTMKGKERHLSYSLSPIHLSFNSQQGHLSLISLDSDNILPVSTLVFVSTLTVPCQLIVSTLPALWQYPVSSVVSCTLPALSCAQWREF
jgi:hypothetical protein